MVLVRVGAGPLPWSVQFEPDDARPRRIWKVMAVIMHPPDHFVAAIRHSSLGWVYVDDHMAFRYSQNDIEASRATIVALAYVGSLDDDTAIANETSHESTSATPASSAMLHLSTARTGQSQTPEPFVAVPRQCSFAALLSVLAARTMTDGAGFDVVDSLFRDHVHDVTRIARGPRNAAASHKLAMLLQMDVAIPTTPGRILQALLQRYTPRGVCVFALQTATKEKGILLGRHDVVGRWAEEAAATGFEVMIIEAETGSRRDEEGVITGVGR